MEAVKRGTTRLTWGTLPLPFAGGLEVPTRLGPYEDVRPFACGGLGVVCRARQRLPEREVAIKILRVGPAASSEQRQRFLHEIRLAAALDHPGIVPVFDAGEQDGWLYFVMPLLEDARSPVDYAEAERLDWRARVELAARAADVVAVLHGQGLLHRDLKPGNILVDHHAGVRLLDFGLALAPAAGDASQTGSSLAGTPAYLAPEQAAGVPARELTPAADVYALGLVTYELLTGRLPYPVDGPLLEALRAVREAPPAPPSSFVPDVPPAVEEVILSALHKDPAQRPADAGAYAATLRYALDPAVAGAPELSSRSHGWSGRRWLPMAATGALVLALSVAGIATGRRLVHRQGSPTAAAALQATASRPPEGRRPTPSLSSIGGPLAEVAPGAPPVARPRWERITLPHTGDWALEFDGRSTSVAVPSLSLDGSHPITIEVILSANDAHKGRIAGGPENTGLWLSAESNRSLFAMARSGQEPTLTYGSLVVPRPIHLAGVWDGREQRLYVNGRRMSAVPRTDPPPGSGPFMVGALPDAAANAAGSFFLGAIQSVRVSSRARYADEFEVEGVLPLRPDHDTLCLLDLEEGEGDVARDSSGHNHHGQIRGARWARQWPCTVPEARLQRVEDDLRRANPGAVLLWATARGLPDGIGMRISALPGQLPSLESIAPLAGLPVSSLEIRGTGVADLTPLRGMPLKELDITGTPVQDLTPLKGRPLVILNAGNTRLGDLSPLRGMPLRYLHLYACPVADLSPLAGMKLAHLGIARTPVTDINVLAGMPLRSLMLSTPVDLRPDVLTSCPALEVVGCVPERHIAALSAALPKTAVLGGYPTDPAARKEYDRVWLDVVLSRVLPATRAEIWPTGSHEAPPATSRADSPRPAQVVRSPRLPWERITLPHIGDWALEFDGKSAAVAIPSLRYDGTHPITIEAVLGANNVHTGRVLGDRAGCWLGAEAQLALFAMGSAGGEPAPLSGPLALPRPIHLAGVWDGREQRLYVSGKCVSRRPCTQPAPGGTPFMVGALPDSEGKAEGASFLGWIQSVRISSRALYTTDFDVEQAVPFRPDKDTLCLLDFEEGNGNLARDSSGHNHHGQIRGARWRRQWPCPVPEARLQGVEDALRWANPGASRLWMTAWGLPDGIGMRINAHEDELAALQDIQAIGGLPITNLSLKRTAVADVRPLHGMPLKELDITDTPVQDLTPLRGCPLVILNAARTRVADLGPLRGMRLRYLHLVSSRVADLAPLAGMPLVHLAIGGTPVGDVSVLAGMPLRSVMLSVNTASQVDTLKRCPTLEVVMNVEAGRVTALQEALPRARIFSVSDSSGPNAQGVSGQVWVDIVYGHVWPDVAEEIWPPHAPAPPPPGEGVPNPPAVPAVQ